MDKLYNLDNLEASFRSYLTAENNNLNPTTIKNYLSDFKHFIGWIRSQSSSDINSVDVSITENSVRDYLKYLNNQSIPLKTLSRRLSTIRRFIAYCQENNLGLNLNTSILQTIKKTNVDEPAYKKVEKPTIKPALPVNKKIDRSLTYTLIIGGTVLGILIALQFTSLFSSSHNPETGKAQKGGRVFAFEGKLTDKTGSNITSLTSIQFKLYNSQTSKKPLYETGICTVTPDRNGYFSVLIGGAAITPRPPQDTCGREIEKSIFTENSSLYLGTTVSSDEEMSPRQQIANVSYSMNSNTINGLPLGSSHSSIPFIAADGSVILSVNSPALSSTYTSGTFSITSGSDLLLQTANEGNITLNATGSGAIRLRTNGSSLDRIFISDEGNVGISTSFPSLFRLEVSGDVGPELGNIFDLGSTTRIWNDVFANRLCFDGSSDCVTSSLGIFSALDQSFSSQFNIKGNLVAGKSVASGTTTLDITGQTTGFALCHSSQNGTDDEKIVDCNSTPTADFAEMYPVEPGSEIGDVMVLGEQIIKTSQKDEIRQLIKAAKPYDHHVIGIISDNTEDFISVGHNISSQDNPLPIALKGRVPVKIAQNSDPIRAGDYLTTSSEKGKAMKAVKDGVVIGKALESWEPGSVKNKVMTFVGIDYVVQEKNLMQQIANNVSSFIDAQVNTLFASKIVTPVVETDELKPAAGKDLTIDLSSGNLEASSSSKLAIRGIKEAVVASIDAEGNIKSNGTIEAEHGLFQKSITTDTIKSRTTDNLHDNLNEVQAKLAKLAQSATPTPTPSTITSSELASLSHESLTDRLIVSDLAEIRMLTVQDTISSRSDTLRLMAGSTITLFDDVVNFDNSGNITTKGTLTAKGLTIKNEEGLTTSSINATGSASFNNLSLPKSAGFSVLPEGENEVEVLHPQLTDSSLIYLTAETNSSTLTHPLTIKKRKICKESELECTNSFTVVLNTSNHDNIRFNWLVLN